jgi:hypothetical protein
MKSSFVILFLIGLNFSIWAMSQNKSQPQDTKKEVATKKTLPDEFKAEDPKKPCDQKPKEIVIEPKKMGLGSGGCKVE